MTELHCNHAQQVNLAYRIGVQKPTRECIRKFSKRFEVTRQNHRNMKELYDDKAVRRDYLVSALGDVDACAEWYRECFGKNVKEVTSAVIKNKMSGGTMTDKNCGWAAMLAARSNLTKWLRGVVDKGDLYNPPDWDDADAPNVGPAMDGDDPDGSDCDDGPPGGGEEEPEVLFSAAAVAARTSKWTQKHKPLRGEKAEAYRDRVQAPSRIN